MAPRETSRDYAHPRRPIVLRTINALGRLRAPARFDVDAIVRKAQAQAKLDELERPEFRPALEVLVDSLEREARLSATGRFIAAQHFHGGLIANLRARAWSVAEPSIVNTPIVRPIMICGLARSGTTLLQRMLAQLPGARSLATWEALEPIPELGWRPPAERLADPRVARAKSAAKFLRWLSPDLFTVHPMDALAPEEEVLMIDKIFRSGAAETTYNVPSFARWLRGQDPMPAYRWLERCLQQLQHEQAGAFWLLKSPHHLEWLDAVFSVFPTITVVQTHRDPAITVPSFCSLCAHGWGVASDHVDPHAVGRHWAEKIEYMLGRALACRDARAGQGFVDVHYDELVAEPLRVVERLCGQLGLSWSEELQAKLDAWLARNRQHEHGIHRYAAEDFGLREGELRERFSAYRQRYC